MQFFWELKAMSLDLCICIVYKNQASSIPQKMSGSVYLFFNPLTVNVFRPSVFTL